jgi:hypothetical protein
VIESSADIEVEVSDDDGIEDVAVAEETEE